MQDATKRMAGEGLVDPVERYRAPKLTPKETVVKRQIDSYRISEIDNSAIIHIGTKAMEIFQSLDLPDATCDGFTFKQRLVQTVDGDCLLLARWKPDRHMRRNAVEWSQKWFVEKELHPPDPQRLFARVGKRVEQQAEDRGEDH